MSLGNDSTQLFHAFSSVLISIMTQLCNSVSFAHMHIIIGKKKTNAIKNIPS